MVDIFRRFTPKNEDNTVKNDNKEIKTKKISVLIPTYNEYDNVVPLSKDITDQFEKMPQYDYELVFIDNDSTDGTRDLLSMLCSRSKKIKSIFNTRNFGRLNSLYYGMCRCGGDCVICMAADYQDPPDMIPKFLEEWENGSEVVCGIDMPEGDGNSESGLFRVLRKLAEKTSGVELTDGFTGFALYDRSFIDVLRELDDPIPYLNGLAAEFGRRPWYIPYKRGERRSGESGRSLYTRYDEAMLGFTTYTKLGLRFAQLFGAAGAVLSVIAAIVCIVLAICRPGFLPGNVPVIIAVSFFGSLQLIFTGLLGEYVININRRTMRRPLVREEQRLNFDDEDAKKKREDKR